MSQVPNNLVEWIRSAVSDNWSSTGKAFLLSQLGMAIQKQNPTYRDQISIGIRRFIEDNNVATIVRHSTSPQKIGAIPNGENIPSNVDNLFSNANGATSRLPRRYYSAFWRAFHSTIKRRRFVIVSENAEEKIQIVESGDVPVETPCYEILASDIVSAKPGSTLADKVKMVEACIDAWVERTGIDPEVLYEKISHDFKNGPQVIEKNRSKNSLTTALDVLEQIDQARIMIPLDIVVKLFSLKR